MKIVTARTMMPVMATQGKGPTLALKCENRAVDTIAIGEIVLCLARGRAIELSSGHTVCIVTARATSGWIRSEWAERFMS